ncbi:PEP-utilizing enzyme [Marinobacter caseinilyticus]|uniref:PEP-utilizing enzyme n=1 Tax=Marinobacter caseinilyticus TaxID=2692195 RepID=UPI00140E1AED|nr:PEP-utilizing enzyme [Marinobacter caseinilyticus]
MNTTTSSAASVFEAPGPGSWSVDAAHFPRPVSRFQAEIHPQGITKGFLDCARRYGLLIDTLDYRFVNGFAYSTVVPAPETEIPARFRAAEDVFRKKIWREDLERWDRDVKPASIRTHKELLAVNPLALSDDELIAYVEQCRDNLERMIHQHHSFNLAAILPVGDFMAHVGAWTDAPIGEFLALTRGSAPESAGTFPEMDRLAKEIRNSPDALQTLTSGKASADILAQLRDAPGPLGEATRDYLGVVGDRLLNSLDTGEPSAIEVPDALLARIRMAVEQSAAQAGAVSEADVSRLREKIPAEHRADFDDLLDEVRLVSRLRDERGFYSDVWAGGVMRRALLSAGARLAADGLIEEAAHLIEASYDEIQALLGRQGGPSGAELAARASYRKGHRVDTAPAELGDPASPPPPMDGLPPHVRRVMTALVTAIQSLGADVQSHRDNAVVRGIGASPGTYSGIARVIDGPDDLGRLERGDVLVTAATTDSFNIVLPLLGAIVTNAGGLLSHAAIVGREYGIPSVVGTRNATAQIADGTRVTVDGTKGEVRIDSP